MKMNFVFKISLIPCSVLGACLFYKTIYTPKYKGTEDLTGKVVVITGGSSGIGKEIAYRLALRKATVVLACRNMDRCKEVGLKIYKKSKNRNVFCSQLDLDSHDSINDFVKRISKNFVKIDILINNAGYKGGFKRECSSDFIEKQLAINAISPFLLTKSLIPLLLAGSESARVIYLVCPHYVNGNIKFNDINSDAENNYNKDEAFNQSQLIRMLTMKYFVDNFSSSSSSSSPSKITFNACDPGPTYSGFHDRSSYNDNIISRNLFKIINLLFLRGVWQAIETPVMLCVSNEMTGKTGKLFRDLEELAIDNKALDPKLVKYVELLCTKWSSSSQL